MKRFLNQAGTSPLIVLVIVLVVAAIGAVGYRVTHQKEPETSLKSSNQKADGGYNSTADLDKANAELDSTDLDSEVNPDQLDEDISQL